MNELTAAHHANKIHPKHYILHGITALVTFAFAVSADIVIIEYSHHKDHRVQWQDGTVSDHYEIKHLGLPSGTNLVQVGMADNGQLVWRVKQ